MEAVTQSAPVPAPVERPRPELVPQPHGGALYRHGVPGNRGNRGQRLAAQAREILRARTPAMARALVRLALKGQLPHQRGDDRVPGELQLKAITAALDRGDVPPRAELSGADGKPLAVVLGVAAAAVIEDGGAEPVR